MRRSHCTGPAQEEGLPPVLRLKEPAKPYIFSHTHPFTTPRLVQSGIRHVRDGLGELLVDIGKLGIRAT